MNDTKYFSSNNMMNDNDIHSSRKKSKFWSKLFRSSCFRNKGRSRKKDKEEEGLRGKPNVNEEYKEVFRTKSYVEIWSKVQVQLKGSSTTQNSKRSFSSSSSSSNLLSSSPSSSLPLYKHLSDNLLEPRQEVVLESIKSSKLQTLLKNYFDVTLEAYNVCEMLLRGIHKTRSNYRIIKRVIRLSTDQLGSNHNHTIQELATFARHGNPLSFTNNGGINFHDIHDDHALLLGKLTSRKRRLNRRQKFIKFYKKTAGYGFIIAYTALAMALLALALHSVVGLLGVPGLLLPFSSGVLKKVDCDKLKPSILERLGEQIDVTAKGAYILVNDFDTMGRLVGRVYDEVEHRRVVADMCVRNSKSQEVVKEAMKELLMHEDAFVEQLEELEEHVYLCFLTINRSRRLVLQQILAP
ncbi:hypothetical protein RND81_03G007300 [Saponaria officinalis]|uniref:Uncharacterized protein n=1 Tax=Saponaria officinalis TaxID=3572 RepID=A0AAW1M2C5_SAPOF